MRFEEFGLIVKFGPHVTIEEALCLWAIRRLLHPDVPLPEVYGWRVDWRKVFVYMELVRGDTHMGRWAALSEEDRISICDQLQKITSSFRGLEQDPQDVFIGIGLSMSSVFVYRD